MNDSEEVQEMLYSAGWFPHRNVINEIQLPEGYEIHDQALMVLKEFSGLHIGKVGPGIDYRRVAISINPMAGISLEEVFQVVSESIHHKLYPIGDIVDDLVYLIAMDERGYVFLLEGEDYQLMGRHFAEALDRILLGKAALPFDPATEI